MLNTRATLYPSVFLFVQKSRLNAMMMMMMMMMMMD